MSGADRPDRSHTTAVVAIPPQALWGPIQAIRARHDRQLRRWMPHVTLLYPFRPPERLEAARARLRAAAAGAAPARLRLGRVRLFRHRRGATLWLEPAPPEALERVQRALQEAFPDLDDVRRHAGGFTPHLSLGQAPLARAEALRGELEAAWTPLDWELDEVQLIRRGAPPDDVFRVVETVPLGGG